jgi:hypothetical protein
MHFKKLFCLFCTVFTNPMSLFAEDILPGKPSFSLDLKKVATLASYKGRSLDCDPLSFKARMGLRLKKINPVDLFRRLVANTEFLTEALYHADDSVVRAMNELLALDQSSATDPSALENLLAGDNFTNAKKGLRLVVLALQKFAKHQGHLDRKTGKPSAAGEVFLECISKIIAHSLERENLKAGSKVLELLKSLNEGDVAVQRALEDLDASWKDPQAVMLSVMELRVLTADVCHDVPAVRDFATKVQKEGQIRTADEFFDDCAQRLKDL